MLRMNLDTLFYACLSYCRVKRRYYSIKALIRSSWSFCVLLHVYRTGISLMALIKGWQVNLLLNGSLMALRSYDVMSAIIGRDRNELYCFLFPHDLTYTLVQQI